MADLLCKATLTLGTALTSVELVLNCALSGRSSVRNSVSHGQMTPDWLCVSLCNVQSSDAVREFQFWPLLAEMFQTTVNNFTQVNVYIFLNINVHHPSLASYEFCDIIRQSYCFQPVIF